MLYPGFYYYTYHICKMISSVLNMWGPIEIELRSLKITIKMINSVLMGKGVCKVRFTIISVCTWVWGVYVVSGRQGFDLMCTYRGFINIYLNWTWSAGRVPIISWVHNTSGFQLKYLKLRYENYHQNYQLLRP